MKKTLICLLLFALISAPAWASPAPDAKHIDSIRKKVASCVDHQRRVVVETYDDRRMLGLITEARADDFVLSSAGHTTTLSYSDVKKVKWPSPLTKEAWAAIGAAAIAGALYGLVVLFGGTRG